MGKFNKALSLGLLLSTLTTNAMAMRFSVKVAENRVDTIKEDLEYLKTIKDSKTTNIFYQNIFGTETLDGESLSNWLDQRVKYIVEQDWDPQKENRLFVLAKVQKDNSPKAKSRNKVVPYNSISKELAATSGDDKKVYVVMSNIGAGLYSAGINMNLLLGVEIETYAKGVEQIVIDSPRTGIAKIGEGLFRSIVSQETREKYNIPDHVIVDLARNSRITTYLHEGRHSDGHGEDLALGHSKCPKNHDYAGHYACEDAVNGPYGINAAIAFENYVNTDKSEKIKMAFNEMTLADGCSRIVKDGVMDMCKDCDAKQISEKITEGIMNCIKAMADKDVKNISEILAKYDYKVRKAAPENVLNSTGITK